MDTSRQGDKPARHQLPPGVLCGCSVTRRPALCDPVDCSTPGLPVVLSPGVNSSSCPSSCDASNHLILCRPLLLPPSVFPSIRVFSKESALPIRKPCSLLPQTPVQSVLKMVLASFHELVSFSGLLPFSKGFLVNFQDSFDQALHKVLELRL